VEVVSPAEEEEEEEAAAGDGQPEIVTIKRLTSPHFQACSLCRAEGSEFPSQYGWWVLEPFRKSHVGKVAHGLKKNSQEPATKQSAAAISTHVKANLVGCMDARVPCR
jgi:hypothetical protein